MAHQHIGSHSHRHGDAQGHVHGHGDRDDWAEMVAEIEAEGEVLLGFVTDSVRWAVELRGREAPPVRRVLDIGSGPGVGSCELARLLPHAVVVAVDGSQAMLERAAQRAAGEGLADRMTTQLVDLPDGAGSLEPADLIWASMSLHHVGDEVGFLRTLGTLVSPTGVIALAERAEPMRALPDDLDVGVPGLQDRLARAEDEWFAGMRAELPGAVESTDLSNMLKSAGFEILGSRAARLTVPAPLSPAARRMVARRLQRIRADETGALGEQDLQALDVLVSEDDPRSVHHRPDVFISSSRQVCVARPIAH